jgi:LEA14-like dessication related protein
MKSRSPLFFAIVLAQLFIFSSCREIKDLELTGIKGFKINRIDTKGVDGDILLGIKNPNRFGFSLYKSEFDISYSGIYLGKAKLAKKVRIKANAEETYAFNLNGDLTNVNLMDVMKLLSGATFKNTLEVKGNLRAGKFYLKKNIPVNLTENIKLN